MDDIGNFKQMVQRMDSRETFRLRSELEDYVERLYDIIDERERVLERESDRLFERFAQSCRNG